ncbi:MAG TPA: cytochrome c [Xanthobacteraceae bacterium]|nr:cytochrome c [Xanthobacteraceae bacterium]
MRAGQIPLLILAIALAAASARAQDGRAERRGEQLLATHCAMCHAIGRQGNSPHRQAPPFRTLAKRYPIEALEEALGEGLYTGHPDMPEFVFAPADVGAILAYLKSIQEP